MTFSRKATDISRSNSEVCSISIETKRNLVLLYLNAIFYLRWTIQTALTIIYIAPKYINYLCRGNINVCFYKTGCYHRSWQVPYLLYLLIYKTIYHKMEGSWTGRESQACGPLDLFASRAKKTHCPYCKVSTVVLMTRFLFFCSTEFK